MYVCTSMYLYSRLPYCLFSSGVTPGHVVQLVSPTADLWLPLPASHQPTLIADASHLQYNIIIMMYHYYHLCTCNTVTTCNMWIDVSRLPHFCFTIYMYTWYRATKGYRHNTCIDTCGESWLAIRHSSQRWAFRCPVIVYLFICLTCRCVRC